MASGANYLPCSSPSYATGFHGYESDLGLLNCEVMGSMADLPTYLLSREVVVVHSLGEFNLPTSPANPTLALLVCYRSRVIANKYS